MILRIGHRGAAGYEPENTLRSFAKAIELKVDWVELDAQVCSGGEVVVIHDRRLERTTNGTGSVAAKDINELRKLDAGKGERIPLLEEVLDLIDRRVKINVELKSQGAASPVAKIISGYVRERSWDWDDFLISSFNHYELLTFHELADKVKLGAIVAGIPLGYAEAGGKLNAYSFHPSKEFINQELIDDAHSRGMKVFVYAVNQEDEIEKLKLMRVDGIFSDYPDRV